MRHQHATLERNRVSADVFQVSLEEANSCEYRLDPVRDSSSVSAEIVRSDWLGAITIFLFVSPTALHRPLQPSR